MAAWAGVLGAGRRLCCAFSPQCKPADFVHQTTSAKGERELYGTIVAQAARLALAAARHHLEVGLVVSAPQQAAGLECDGRTLPLEGSNAGPAPPHAELAVGPQELAADVPSDDAKNKRRGKPSARLQ